VGDPIATAPGSDTDSRAAMSFAMRLGISTVVCNREPRSRVSLNDKRVARYNQGRYNSTEGKKRLLRRRLSLLNEGRARRLVVEPWHASGLILAANFSSGAHGWMRVVVISDSVPIKSR